MAGVEVGRKLSCLLSHLDFDVLPVLVHRWQCERPSKKVQLKFTTFIQFTGLYVYYAPLHRHEYRVQQTVYINFTDMNTPAKRFCVSECIYRNYYVQSTTMETYDFCSLNILSLSWNCNERSWIVCVCVRFVWRMRDTRS